MNNHTPSPLALRHEGDKEARTKRTDEVCKC